MFYWKIIKPGYHVAYRDSKRVACAERTRDTGEPLWELSIFDGTELPKSSKGNQFFTFCTLGDAKFAYGRAYRLAHQET